MDKPFIKATPDAIKDAATSRAQLLLEQAERDNREANAIAAACLKQAQEAHKAYKEATEKLRVAKSQYDDAQKYLAVTRQHLADAVKDRYKEELASTIKPTSAQAPKVAVRTQEDAIDDAATAALARALSPRTSSIG